MSANLLSIKLLPLLYCDFNHGSSATVRGDAGEQSRAEEALVSLQSFKPLSGSVLFLINRELLIQSLHLTWPKWAVSTAEAKVCQPPEYPPGCAVASVGFLQTVFFMLWCLCSTLAQKMNGNDKRDPRWPPLGTSLITLTVIGVIINVMCVKGVQVVKG